MLFSENENRNILLIKNVIFFALKSFIYKLFKKEQLRCFNLKHCFLFSGVSSCSSRICPDPEKWEVQCATDNIWVHY